MPVLYLNSSVEMELGIWQRGQWLFYQNYPIQKNSEWFHLELYSQLDKLSLKVGDIEKIVWCSGPGSYTGLRMAAGVVEVLRWQGLQECSFYSHEVPKILGVPEGAWVSFAFKEEYFIYRWDEKESSSSFVAKNQIGSIDLGDKVFGPKNILLDKAVRIENLIKDNFEVLISSLTGQDKIKRPIFYYRPPEKEFKISQY